MLPCSIRPYGFGAPCLDRCGGLQGALPGIDQYKYRYYLAGNLTNLSCSAHVGHLRCAAFDRMPCCASELPSPSVYPFTMQCFQGCTYEEVANGTCTGISGLARIEDTPKVSSAVTTRFTGMLHSMYNLSASRPLKPGLALSSTEINRLRGAAPMSPSICFRVAALNEVTFAEHAPRLSSPVCASLSMPPSRPAFLNISHEDSSTVLLTWGDATSDLSHPILSYEVLLKKAWSSEWELLVQTAAGVKHAVIDTCSHGLALSARVRARNEAGWSSFSEISFLCADKPSAPEKLRPLTSLHYDNIDHSSCN